MDYAEHVRRLYPRGDLVPLNWDERGEQTVTATRAVPRYCFAPNLVAESATSQAWNNEHDFRAIVLTERGDYSPVQTVDFHCCRCLLQLSGADAIAFHRAVYA